MNPANPTDSTQRRLGDFVLDAAPLSRGEFKTVYAADNSAAGTNGWPQRVAVNIPRIQDDAARALLDQELRAVRALNHPGIVRAFGIAEAEGRFLP